jgi:AcrR family transcriptional regulator
MNSGLLVVGEEIHRPAVAAGAPIKNVQALACGVLGCRVIIRACYNPPQIFTPEYLSQHMNKQIKTLIKPSEDGRVLRSQRSREAIINSAYQFMEIEGAIPTAQVVADNAGVTIRTLFRHFPEMDLLYRELHRLTYERYAKEYAKGDRTGPLEDRVLSAVKTFTAAYSNQRNVFLVTKSMLRSSVFLRENYSLMQRNLSKRLLEWIPELGNLPDEIHDGVDGVLSFEFWHRLHVIQGISKKRSISIINRLVLGFLSEKI